MTPDEELAQLLDDLGHGTYAPSGDTTIFLGLLGEAPDEALAVAPYAGPASSVHLGYDDTRMQVRVRGDLDYRTGAARAQALYDDLHGRTGDLPGGTPCLLIECLQSCPVYLGGDEKRRHEWSINLRLYLRRRTAHRT